LTKGVELGLKPLSVAMLDAGGHMIAFQRQDGASTLRPQIASAKASSAMAALAWPSWPTLKAFGRRRSADGSARLQHGRSSDLPAIGSQMWIFRART
jgi:uncharacterized protein GlcG (DUF336 family)